MTSRKDKNPFLNKWDGDGIGPNPENENDKMVAIAFVLYQTIRLMHNRDDKLSDADMHLYLAAFEKWRNENPIYKPVFDYINMQENASSDDSDDNIPLHALLFLRGVYDQVEKMVNGEAEQ